eukprot:GHVP01039670.1.p1 GENE.GHVP01039670.1~~GHVP01039670.1.p1  ORF type:complete len:288 (+),score=61.02 GHVP01039670.1:57-920(+)
MVRKTITTKRVVSGGGISSNYTSTASSVGGSRIIPGPMPAGSYSSYSSTTRSIGAPVVSTSVRTSGTGLLSQGGYSSGFSSHPGFPSSGFTQSTFPSSGFTQSSFQGSGFAQGSMLSQGGLSGSIGFQPTFPDISANVGTGSSYSSTTTTTSGGLPNFPWGSTRIVGGIPTIVGSEGFSQQWSTETTPDGIKICTYVAPDGQKFRLDLDANGNPILPGPTSDSQLQMSSVDALGKKKATKKKAKKVEEEESEEEESEEEVEEEEKPKKKKKATKKKAKKVVEEESRG